MTFAPRQKEKVVYLSVKSDTHNSFPPKKTSRGDKKKETGFDDTVCFLLLEELAYRSKDVTFFSGKTKDFL